MPDPINYTSAFADLKSPTESFMQGVQGAAAIQQLQVQQQQVAAAAQQKLQMQADLSALSKNPTTQAIGQMSIKYPQLSEQFKRSFDILAPAQQQAKLDHATQVYAALHNGEPKVAQQILTDQATALRNSGNETDAKAAETMASLIDAHPEFAQTTAGLMISSAMGPDKFAAAFPAIGGEQRAQAQAPADLAKKQADAKKAGIDARVAGATAPAAIKKADLENEELISKTADRGARLGLDADIFTTGTKIKLAELKQKFGELPDDARKLVNEGAVTAAGAEQAVAQYADLAQKIDGLGGSWGAGSTAHEFLKRATGSEDAISGLKREYTRMASTGVLKLLPPGPASDKDVALAREGIPNSNSSPEVMASYLRGMAKLSSYDAAFNNAKSEWAGAVRHLGTAKTDIEIDGVKVPAGTTFNAFARQFIEKKADQSYNAAITQRRSYMRFAQPPATTPSVQPARAESPVIGD